ncbi:MAG: hypothetical protein KAT15_05520, partial [Bacteroidales bacterium]|nr:hypothetical protein [Bacteroidales bacterium]
MKQYIRIFLSALLVLAAILTTYAQDKKALEVTDIMKFRQLRSVSISGDGNWVVHTAKPDRGDPEVLVYSTDGKKEYSIPRGEKPVLSPDGKWVAAVNSGPAEDLLKSKPAKDDPGPKAGLILLNTSTGEQTVYGKVQSFQFSNDSKWLLFLNFREEEEKEDGKEITGSVLNVISLQDEIQMSFPFVAKYSIDSVSRFLVFAVADTTRAGNGAFLVDLDEGSGQSKPVYTDSNSWANYFSWNNRTGDLAFLAGILDKKENPGDAELFFWSPGEQVARSVLSDTDLTDEWKIYHTNSLRWTKDGERLFLGIKPVSEIIPTDKENNDS